jgi:hypothetical protein
MFGFDGQGASPENGGSQYQGIWLLPLVSGAREGQRRKCLLSSMILLAQ